MEKHNETDALDRALTGPAYLPFGAEAGAGMGLGTVSSPRHQLDHGPSSTAGRGSAKARPASCSCASSAKSRIGTA